MMLEALVRGLKNASPTHLAAGAVLLAGVAVAGFMASQGALEERPSGVIAIDPTTLALLDGLVNEQGILDTDLDLIPDTAENMMYGSDPASWNSSGSGIPDGWLARYGYSPVDPTVGWQPAAVPGRTDLPATYGNAWPDRFALTLTDVYRLGRPVDWNETAQGPFENGIDPRSWDQTGDGLPDGWLIHYGLDPRNATLATARLADPEGLTVAQAFEHNTSPLLLDTDDDGITDRDEIEGPVDPTRPGSPRFPPTDPARYDTSGTGVCDGYLASHGLDPSDPANGYGDLDSDGATTVAEFQWSLGRFGQEACSQGQGLDPTAQQTQSAGIPDGWLMMHGLDPLQSGVAATVTQSTKDDTLLAGVPPAAAEVKLTVLDEYMFGRPTTWLEARDGPWWGGTEPANADSDGDGLSDAWELGGYTLKAAAEPGASGFAEYTVVIDPTSDDTDQDGLSDLDEVRGRTDGTRRDTDFDGLTDAFEAANQYLDPLQADTAGDLLRDGDRYAFLVAMAKAYADDVTYRCPGRCLDTDVTQWLAKAPGADPGPLDAARIAQLVGPEGNINGRTNAHGDPVPNIIDPDIDDDGIVNGAEIDPSLYTDTHFGLGPLGARTVSDPLNRDTDGDGLPDGWEVGHGRPAGSVYSLDPSDWDADGDGRGDGQEDFDADGIVWHDFRTDPRGVPIQEPHDNLREFQFGTDPYDRFSDADGLLDGWKVFWSILYPGIDEVAVGAPRPTPGLAQPADEPSSLLLAPSYWRYALQGSPLDAGRGEVASGTAVAVHKPAGQIILRNVTGTAFFRMHDAQRVGTSPYELDTDGDGMPDWWEDMVAAIPAGVAQHAQCVGAPGPDPLRPDGGADPDQDGLANAAEWARGSHPRCKDTDMAGVPDGEETTYGLHPGDPADDVRLQDQDLDTDGDGLSDFTELTQTFTLVASPDSDGDGLLDGQSLPAQGCWSGTQEAAMAFLDLGVAYRKDAAGCLHFLGERDATLGFDPLDGDDYGIGVPAGWMQMKMPGYSGTPEARQTASDHYRLGRPAWWQENAHGPWWGGADPAATFRVPAREPLANIRNSLDLDGDGLADRDAGGAPAEDAYPSGNSINAPRSIPGLPPGADPRDSGLQLVMRRLAAQAILNPAPHEFSHNTIPHPTYDPANDERASACIQLDAVPGTLAKGTPATVRGSLSTCDGAPIARTAVQAVLGGQPFGAGFTDTSGQFAFDVNVSSSQRSLTVPGAAASAWRGSTGTVTWQPDAAAVPPGQRTLTIQSYATQQHRRVAAASPVLVTASSTITIEVPDEVRAQEATPAKLTLRDSAGMPLRHTLRLTWAGQRLPDAVPGGDGVAEVFLAAVAPPDAGPVLLRVESVPPASDPTAPGSAERQIFVKRPTVMDVSGPPAAVAGDEITVRGQLRSSFGAGTQRGEAAAAVEVRLESGSEAVVTRLATTRSDGRFTLTIGLPPDLRSGVYQLRASAPATDATLAGQADAAMTVRGVPELRTVSQGALRAAGPHAVGGWLLGPDGLPLGGRVLTITLGDATQTAATAGNGTFHTTFHEALAPGPVLQRVTYAGDASHGSARHEVERFVVSSTSLAAANGTIARGAAAQLPMTLRDASGHGVAGATVLVRWGDDPPTSVVTGADGQATFQRMGNAHDRLGTVPVAIAFDGNPGSGLGPTSVARTWSVQARATIEWPGGPIVAGEGAPMATLLDEGTRAPLPQRSVHVRLAGEALRVVQTDSQGRFQFLAEAPAPDAAPRLLQLSAMYPGNREYPAAASRTELRLILPVTLDFDLPLRLVAGQAAVMHVQLLDGRQGVPSQGTLEASIDGQVIGRAPAGTASLGITVPISHRAPSARIDVHYNGSATHDSASASQAVEVLQPSRLEIQASRARPGGVARVIVTLLAGDQPIAGHPVHLFIEGVPGGFEGTTDDQGRATFRIEQGNHTMRFLARAPGGADFSPTSSAGLLEAAAATPPPHRPAWPWLAGAAALALAGLGLAGARMRRTPLAAAFHRARGALHARGPNERAILEAYRVLEDAAIALELLSAPAKTPRGLEKAFMRALPETAHGWLDRLVGLFEVARYGVDPMGSQHRQSARQCLMALQRALEAKHTDTTARGGP